MHELAQRHRVPQYCQSLFEPFYFGTISLEDSGIHFRNKYVIGLHFSPIPWLLYFDGSEISVREISTVNFYTE
jgi:hypothetical protein